MFQYFKLLINSKQVWREDYFHALAEVKGVVANEIRLDLKGSKKRLKFSFCQRLKWTWATYLRYRGMPYAYIFNYTDFLGQRFYIDKRVLIPRVETEELASLVAEDILFQIQPSSHDAQDSICKVKSPAKPKNKIRILDIGVGSGVLGLSVVKALMNYLGDKVDRWEVELVGIDKSKSAIAVAKRNKVKLFSNRFGKKNIFDFEKIKTLISINFLVKDIFHPATQSYLEDNPFDFVLSNPPYIEKDSDDLAKEVEKYEPSWALFGGSDGLDFYRHFANYGASWFRRGQRRDWGGRLYLEIGFNQGDKVKELFLKKQPNTPLKIKVIKDIFGKNRFVWVIYPPTKRLVGG